MTDEMEKISLRQFKKETESDYYKGLLDGFNIVCKKCGSDNVKMLEKTKNEMIFAGCNTCGYGRSAEFDEATAVKCENCGNARKIERHREVP